MDQKFRPQIEIVLYNNIQLLNEIRDQTQIKGRRLSVVHDQRIEWEKTSYPTRCSLKERNEEQMSGSDPGADRRRHAAQIRIKSL